MSLDLDDLQCGGCAMLVGVMNAERATVRLLKAERDALKARAEAAEVERDLLRSQRTDVQVPYEHAQGLAEEDPCALRSAVQRAGQGAAVSVHDNPRHRKGGGWHDGYARGRAELEPLRARIDRLRAVLEDICMTTHSSQSDKTVRALVDHAARAALARDR